MHFILNLWISCLNALLRTYHLPLPSYDLHLANNLCHWVQASMSEANVKYSPVSNVLCRGQIGCDHTFSVPSFRNGLCDISHKWVILQVAVTENSMSGSHIWILLFALQAMWVICPFATFVSSYNLALKPYHICGHWLVVWISMVTSTCILHTPMQNIHLSESR